MVAIIRNPDVLAEVVARVLDAGAARFELEYEDGEEHLVAFTGAVGFGIAAFRSDSEDAQELRRQLHEALIERFMVLFLRGADEVQSSQLRADQTRLAYMTGGYNTDSISAVGRGRLSQLLTLAQYGDYVAYYLALLYGLDPAGAESARAGNAEQGA